MDASTRTLLRQAQTLFRKEGRLIRLPSQGTLICAGDTHGDLEAATAILDCYLRPGCTLLFLGDYIDRGTHSREVITLLLQKKLEHPEQILLLQGNHEGWKAGPFSPCNFWENLDTEEQKLFADVLSDLPFMAEAQNGLIACHGALPDVASLDAIRKIQFGSEEWRSIVWGDWQESSGRVVGDFGGRPQFGKKYFDDVMGRLGKSVLLRAHQPDTPLFLYDERCVTIFSSRFYSVKRRVAAVGLGETLKSGADIRIETC